MNPAPLLLAMGLLTVFPVTRTANSESFNELNRARAIDYYGIVGLLIGIMVVLSFLVFGAVFPNGVTAAALLIIWVAITGALHLDGLADCSDAAAAGHGNANRYLEVMKTPTVGAIAVVVVCLHLLLKYTLLSSLLNSGHTPYVMFSLVYTITLSRILAAFYQQNTPYARTHGLGISVNTIAFRLNALLLILVTVVGSLYFFSLRPLIGIACSAVLLYFWRRFWMQRISGYTGDCLGAYIELNESVLLAIAVINLGMEF